MPTGIIPKRIADDVFEIETSSSEIAQALASQVRDLNLAIDVVAGLKSVCVRVSPQRMSALHSAFSQLEMPVFDGEQAGEAVELLIRYGGDSGPDFEHVRQSLGLSESAFIELHSGREHRVDMIGFTPGFSYLSGLPDHVEVPRRSVPRARVPAGAVGVSGSYTGIYALAGPGGWPLIGQIQDVLFAPDADQPFKLLPGHRVRFKAV